MKRQARGLVLLPVYVAALLMVIWTLFPFAVAFTLCDGKGNERLVPPGGARSNLKAYLR